MAKRMNASYQCLSRHTMLKSRRGALVRIERSALVRAARTTKCLVRWHLGNSHDSLTQRCEKSALELSWCSARQVGIAVARRQVSQNLSNGHLTAEVVGRHEKSPPSRVEGFILVSVSQICGWLSAWRATVCPPT